MSTSPRRLWTTLEIEKLKALWPLYQNAEVARRLGRSLQSVENAAALRGLAKHRRTKIDNSFSTRAGEMHRQGMSDREIADALGCERHTVGDWRRRHKLADNRLSSRRRALVGEKTKAQLEESGAASLAELKSLTYRVKAAARGWPPDCTPRMCDVLDLLHRDRRGMTKREICAALGIRYHRCKVLNHQGIGVLTWLKRMGLVEWCGRRAFAPGKGQTEWVYALAAGVAPRRSLADREGTTQSSIIDAMTKGAAA